MGGLGISMKNNKTAITGLLLFVTVVLLGSTVYISMLLTSPTDSPTQIQKTRASAITYKKTIELTDFGAEEPTGEPSPGVSPSVSPSPTKSVPTATPTVKPTSALIAKAPTLAPTSAPRPTVTVAPAVEPTDIPEVVTPTLQPLLAYKSTTLTPTLIPIRDNTGGMVSPTISKSTPTPAKMAVTPTGVQKLPETGWVQTSSILFIVAATTILFSLLF